MLELTIAVVSGGVIQHILSYFINNRKEDRMDMDRITAMLKSDNDRLREEDHRCKERVDELESKVIDCKKEMLEVEARVKTLESKISEYEEG